MNFFPTTIKNIGISTLKKIVYGSVFGGLACLSACSETSPSTDANEPTQRLVSDDETWRVSPDGDLNSFFDCLEDAGQTLISAHRGGAAPGFPENAIETMSEVLTTIPAIMEVDVATSADGVMFLLHDDTLDRTTTGIGIANSTDWDDIKSLRLVDDDGNTTLFTPPTLAQTLDWAKDRTILQLDMKRSTRFEDVIDLLRAEDAFDRTILIAYSLGAAKKLHRLAPDAMISLSMTNGADKRAAVDAIPSERLIAFTGTDAFSASFGETLENDSIEIIFGTLGGRNSIDEQIRRSGDAERYAHLAEDGVDIIATDRPLAAHSALAREELDADSCGIQKG